MKLICGPRGFALRGHPADLAVDLYSQPRARGRASAGEAVRSRIVRSRLRCDRRAWDLLSIALSVVTADFAVLRSASPDGWTREFELDIAVADESFWNEHALPLARALAFLTTDRWTFRFHPGGMDVPRVGCPPTATSGLYCPALGGARQSRGRHRSRRCRSQSVGNQPDRQRRRQHAAPIRGKDRWWSQPPANEPRCLFAR